MMPPLDPGLVLIVLAALLAGFVDAIAGGGGLILTPALFAGYPGEAAATMLGTNKSASTWGSAMAAWTYTRRVALMGDVVWWGGICCLLGGAMGAAVLVRVPSDPVRIGLPVVLLGLLVYTLRHRDLGSSHSMRYAAYARTRVASAIGFGVGFYDGFLGPGTGSFLVFLFVRVLGFDFVTASAHARVFNFFTNIAALSVLALKGHVLWTLTPFLLVANVAGNYIGSHMAMRHGTAFVRGVFVLVVSALIVKTGGDALGLLQW